MFYQSMGWLILVNGMIVACFGFFGYRNTGSLPSLYAGVGSGILLIGGAVGLLAQKRFGKILSLTATAMLTLLFAYRYAIAGKFFLAALGALNAASFIALCFTRLRRGQHPQRNETHRFR